MCRSMTFRSRWVHLNCLELLGCFKKLDTEIFCFIVDARKPKVEYIDLAHGNNMFLVSHSQFQHL